MSRCEAVWEDCDPDGDKTTRSERNDGARTGLITGFEIRTRGRVVDVVFSQAQGPPGTKTPDAILELAIFPVVLARCAGRRRQLEAIPGVQ